MSLSVNGTNNPFALLQSLWQQGSASGTQTQSDPLSALLGALDQQNTGGTSSGNGTTSSSTMALTAGGSAPLFGPQTLQALLAQQANGANSQSLLSQLADGANGSDPLSELQGNQTQGQLGHHHHHHVGSGGSTDTSSGASGDSTTADASGSAGANASGNNFLEQLMQMQGQLVSPPNTQSLATA